MRARTRRSGRQESPVGSLRRWSAGNPNGRVICLVDGVTTADALTGRQKLGMVGFLARNGSAVVRAGEEGDRTEDGRKDALWSKGVRGLKGARQAAERQGLTPGNITVVLDLGSGAQPNGTGVMVLPASGPIPLERFEGADRTGRHLLRRLPGALGEDVTWTDEDE